MILNSLKRIIKVSLVWIAGAVNLFFLETGNLQEV